nr:uncharacterized protein CTRU02_03348 [Colletotrichum truncatum]KAF6797317.1 hypothetical protein CTRU02_03348 [Colletotrichum truncatum]
MCGDFWTGLNQFKHSCTVSVPNCENVDGVLNLRFMTASSCNAGMIASAWWEATKNKYGNIQCS